MTFHGKNYTVLGMLWRGRRSPNGAHRSPRVLVLDNAACAEESGKSLELSVRDWHRDSQEDREFPFLKHTRQITTKNLLQHAIIGRYAAPRYYMYASTILGRLCKARKNVTSGSNSWLSPKNMPWLEPVRIMKKGSNAR